MAGIGFKIQKLLSEETYWGVMRGYFYSAVLSSGPWLTSILCFGALSMIGKARLGDSYEAFRAWVMYCYCASIVLTGGLQMAATRYMSDCIYRGEAEKIFSSFAALSLAAFPVQIAAGAAYLAWCGMPPAAVFGGAVLFAVISEIWICMIYLSAARDYLTLVWAHIIGFSLSFVATAKIGPAHGLAGFFFGYGLGQVVLLAMLLARIAMEFPVRGWWNRELFHFIRHNGVLLVTGFCYNAAIWVDKILFWIFRGESAAPGLQTCPYYDTPTYLAYVTVVPALSIFLIRVETSFYRSYRRYYYKIQQKFPFAEILAGKREMMDSLILSLYRLLVFQGPITALTIAYAYPIVRFFNLEATQLPLLRIAVLASFVHALFMVLMIFILYFDWKHLALRCCVLFCVANIALTCLFLRLDLSWQGYGWFFSGLIALGYGAQGFLKNMGELERITFTSQPLGSLRWDVKP